MMLVYETLQDILDTVEDGLNKQNQSKNEPTDHGDDGIFHDNDDIDEILSSDETDDEENDDYTYEHGEL